MGHFFSRYSYRELASALARINPRLAAQMGGIAFERMVRTRAGADVAVADKDLKTLIDELWQNGVIDSLTKGQWHNARRIRNKAIHGFDAPTQHEIMSLLTLLD
jgi:hypothetical protein